MEIIVCSWCHAKREVWENSWSRYLCPARSVGIRRKMSKFRKKTVEIFGISGNASGSCFRGPNYARSYRKCALNFTIIICMQLLLYSRMFVRGWSVLFGGAYVVSSCRKCCRKSLQAVRAETMVDGLPRVCKLFCRRGVIRRIVVREKVEFRDT